jgi:riboflavin synthase
VAINGVSLTVNSISQDIFSMNLIPHTLEQTSLQFLKNEALVNIEVDLIARYVERMAEWEKES